MYVAYVMIDNKPNTDMRKFDKGKFKEAIKKEFGSVRELKRYLKEDAEDIGFDVKLSKVVIDGVTVKYSGNPNHFAKYYVELPHVGMTGTYALDYDSFTRAGKRRGSGNGRIIL